MMSMVNKTTKLYRAGRITFIILLVLIVLSFILEYLYGCDGACDQNTFEGLGNVLIVLPAVLASFAVSVASLSLFLIDRYRTKGSIGMYRRRGAWFILSIITAYIVILSSNL